MNNGKFYSKWSLTSLTSLFNMSWPLAVCRTSICRKQPPLCTDRDAIELLRFQVLVACVLCEESVCMDLRTAWQIGCSHLLHRDRTWSAAWVISQASLRRLKHDMSAKILNGLHQTRAGWVLRACKDRLFVHSDCYRPSEGCLWRGHSSWKAIIQGKSSIVVSLVLNYTEACTMWTNSAKGANT